MAPKIAVLKVTPNQGAFLCFGTLASEALPPIFLSRAVFLHSCSIRRLLFYIPAFLGAAAAVTGRVHTRGRLRGVSFLLTEKLLVAILQEAARTKDAPAQTQKEDELILFIQNAS